MNRRAFLSGISLLALSACGGGGSTPTRGPEPDFPKAPNPGWDQWVADFLPRAQARGVSQSTLDAAFRDAGYLPGAVERYQNQTEFKRSLEDYLAIAASDERVAQGKAAMSSYAGLLDDIEARYGVDKDVIVAVWGLESFYGTRQGTAPVISALSTLAYASGRSGFYEDQLVAALKILQRGDITPSRMTGSWAGAMGQTQFIPTTYLAYAVDFAGDGKADIWSADPTDSLASAANYLKKSGWTKGQPWGVEVVLPPGFNTGLAGRGKGRSPSEWAAMGVRAATGGTVPDYGAASIILPSGASGPAFMIFNNFNVILRYNNAESYAIGVGHLSDRISGGAKVQASFPPDAAGLTQADRQRIQQRLTALGFDTGGTDGVIGAKSEAAIRAFQQSRGLPVTGQATKELLAALG